MPIIFSFFILTFYTSQHLTAQPAQGWSSQYRESQNTFSEVLLQGQPRTRALQIKTLFSNLYYRSKFFSSYASTDKQGFMKEEIKTCWELKRKLHKKIKNDQTNVALHKKKILLLTNTILLSWQDFIITEKWDEAFIAYRHAHTLLILLDSKTPFLKWTKYFYEAICKKDLFTDEDIKTENHWKILYETMMSSASYKSYAVYSTFKYITDKHHKHTKDHDTDLGMHFSLRALVLNARWTNIPHILIGTIDPKKQLITNGMHTWDGLKLLCPTQKIQHVTSFSSINKTNKILLQTLRNGVLRVQIPMCFWSSHHDFYAAAVKNENSKRLFGTKTLWPSHCQVEEIALKCHHILGISKDFSSKEKVSGIFKGINFSFYITQSGKVTTAFPDWEQPNLNTTSLK